MSGLLGLVGRGSIGQAVLAVVLAFIFFAIALKHQPFTSGQLNFLKICSEAQLFGVLVLCLVIQAVEIGPVGLSAETITTDGYGVIMVVVAAVAVPIALGSICLLARDVRERRRAAATDALAHATAVEDARPEACQADLRPETFEQEFVVAGARRAALTRPIPARPTAQPQQAAATNWVEIHSEEHGRVYWLNSDTQETTWDRPVDLGTTATAVTTGSTTNPGHDSQEDSVTVHNQVPSGWSEYFSTEQDRPFWVDDSTGESTWVRPVDHGTTAATTWGSTTNPVHDSHQDSLDVHNQVLSGWSEQFSTELEHFWVDDSTGESTWVRPNDMAT